MIVPNTLNIGDSVAIISSARAISFEEIKNAKLLFEQWGLNVVLGKTIGVKDNQFAGNDKWRCEDLQTMLDDEQIKAIFFARGGYGSIRILDEIIWESLSDNPKWLVGYSDITAILMHSYFNVSIQSIHAIMPVNINSLFNNTAISSLKNILFKGNNSLICDYHPFNKEGTAHGILIGGNLSVIYSLLGSNSWKDCNDIILFIEDLDEYLYHIDRMLQALKRSGKLKGLKALLVGQMSNMHDNTIPFGTTAYEIIKDNIKDYDFPCCFNLPIGHIGQENHAFIHGRLTEVIVNNKITIINQ